MSLLSELVFPQRGRMDLLFPPKGAYGFAVSPKGGVWEEGAISPRKMAA